MTGKQRNRGVYAGLLALLLTLLVGAAAAQDGEVIALANVDRLQPVSTIDYDSAPEAAGALASGWLRVSNDGAHVVTINRANDLLLWSTSTGDLLDVYTIPGADGTNANMLDIAWHDDDTYIHSVHTDGANHYVAVYELATGVLQIITTPTGGDDPVRVWADPDPAYTWVEVIPADSGVTPYVQRLALADGSVDTQLDSAPEAVRDAAVRIGRMPAPLAVTSSMEGDVMLWDMETGAVLHEVAVGDVPMFGHINGASGRLLTWRDPMSEKLHLLDFETGENQLVATLDGAYAQALLVTPSADVILGVNIDLAPVVVAWDVATGAVHDLGEYRTCSRTPDMVQLSTDGTTLVIGCDTGLDVWRVGE